jgi:hypothetical protein
MAAAKARGRRLGTPTLPGPSSAGKRPAKRRRQIIRDIQTAMPRSTQSLALNARKVASATAADGGMCRCGRYWIGQSAVAQGIKIRRAPKARSHNPTSLPSSDTSTATEPLPIARVIGLRVAAEAPAATAQAMSSRGALLVCAAGRRSSGPKAGMISSF